MPLGLSKGYFYILLFCLALSCFFLRPHHTCARENDRPLSLVLVIDTSQSMDRTDPLFLREKGARLLIDALDYLDHLALIVFNDRPFLVRKLAPAGDAALRETIKEELTLHLAARGSTGLKEALEVALKELKQDGGGVRVPAVLLLTDGEPNPYPGSREDDDFMTAYLAETDALLKDYYRLGFPIYAVGFSDEVDESTLAWLARSTRGDFFVLPEAAGVPGAFVSIMEQLRRQQVRDIPGLEIVVEKSPAARYRRGESAVTSASLQLGGGRLLEGPALAVQEMTFVLDYHDGERKKYELYDSGDIINHGDARAGDGIWSSLVSFDQAGEARISLEAEVVYRGTLLTLEKDMGRLDVQEPGRIEIYMPGELAAAEGTGKVSVPVTVINHSSFREGVFIKLESQAGRVSPEYLSLEPGETLSGRIEISPEEAVTGNTWEAELAFRPDHPLTVIEPDRADLKVQTRPFPLHLFYRAAQYRGAPLYLFLTVMGAALLLVGGGALLYRFLVFSRAGRLRGSLYYSMRAGGGSPVYSKTSFHRVSWKVDLEKTGKERFVISMGGREKREGVDLVLEGEGQPYIITLSPSFNWRGFFFFQGWKALLTGLPESSLLVECSKPGVLEWDGGVYSNKIIYSGEEFISGGYHFLFTSPGTRAAASFRIGKDLLGEGS